MQKEAIQHFMYCLDNPQDLSAEQLTEALSSMGRICEFHHLTDQVCTRDHMPVISHFTDLPSPSLLNRVIPLFL